MARVLLKHPPARLARTFVKASSQQLTRNDVAGDLSFKITGSSLSVWFRLTAFNSGNSMHVVGKWGLSSQQNFLISASNSLCTFNSSGQATQLGAISLATWYHVIGWYDPADQKLYAQLNNGTPVASSAITAFQTNIEHFKIGNSGLTETGSSAHFDGYISRILLADRLWTEAERTWLHNGGESRHFRDLGRPGAGSNMLTSLRAAWMTAEEAGANALDSYTGGYTLTQFNNVGTAAGPP